MKSATSITSVEQPPAAGNAGQPPLLDLDLLRTLVAIAETGNFSAAAAAVFRSPSAISMQVRRIEELIGRPVFTRDSRSVTLTDTGELLLGHARRMLALNNELVGRFVKPDIAGLVRLGVTDDLVERAIPGLLKRFSQTHCGVTVDVVVDGSGALAERVGRGDLDLVLLNCDGAAHAGGTAPEVLHREPLTWAGARNGIAHEQQPLPVSVWEESCTWRQAGLAGLTAAGRDYRIAFLSAHLAGQRAALLADLAIAPIPLSACVDGLVALGARQGLPSLPDYAVGMLVRHDPGPAVDAAAQYCRDSFAQDGLDALCKSTLACCG